MSANSFGARAELEVGGRTYEIFRIDALQASLRRRAAAVLAEDPAREPAAQRGRRGDPGRRHRGAGEVEREGRAERGDRLHARPRGDAGLHRRPGDRRPRRDARRDAGDGRRPEQDQPAGAGRAGDRPLRPGRRVRLARRRSSATPSSSSSATRSATRSCAGARPRSTTSRWCRRTPGIVHQVNLEYLARVVFVNEPDPAHPVAYPDTLVGTDSHTTMINGLGVLGWGVGGIEAEAAMLGQPMSMLIPQVIGFRLDGELPEGATATDLVLTVTEMLRRRGVVGKFVEFFGAGLAKLPLADRATIGNMSPEFGSTCAIFPIDAETLRYLEFSGRPPEQIELVEAYAKAAASGTTRAPRSRPITDVLRARPVRRWCRASPGPSARRTACSLTESKQRSSVRFEDYLSATNGEEDEALADTFPASDPVATHVANGGALQTDTCQADARRRHRDRARQRPRRDRRDHQLHQHLEPVGDARRRAAGPQRRAEGPEGQAMGQDLARARLQGGDRVPRPGRPHRVSRRARLQPRRLRLHHLHRQQRAAAADGISKVVDDHDLAVVSVLSGNRNFEGRINPDVKMNYLASPPLCRRLRDRRARWTSTSTTSRWARTITASPSTSRTSGRAPRRSPRRSRRRSSRTCSTRATARCSTATSAGTGSRSRPATCSPGTSARPTCAGRRSSRTCRREPEPLEDISDARVLAVLGDSVTTDHISPAGSIKQGGPAAQYLNANHVETADFNSYGSRRGNHEVMMRGTFANIRLRNRLARAGWWAGSSEGGVTLYLADGIERGDVDLRRGDALHRAAASR